MKGKKKRKGLVTRYWYVKKNSCKKRSVQQKPFFDTTAQ